jgi:hypothetical protein
MDENGSIRADLVGGDDMPVRECRARQQPARLTAHAIHQDIDPAARRPADPQPWRAGLVGSDVRSYAKRPRSAALIGRWSGCAITGIDGRAAG